MRVLVVTDNYFPNRAACAVRMKVLAEELIKHGHQVRVLASDSNLASASFGYKQPEYVSFFPVIPLVEKSTINRLKNNFSCVLGAIKAAEGLGVFDYVICTSPPLLLALAAITIAKRYHAKLVFDVRDIWPDVAYEMGSFVPGSLYGRIFSAIAARAYCQASIICTVSPGKVQKLKNRVSGDRERVKLVPNGLDISFVEQVIDEEVVSRFGLERGPICCYVGNVGLAQGLSSIFQLARHREDARFLVFGDGAERSSLEKRAASEGLDNVEFCGTLDSRGVYTVLRYSDVSFVPLVSSKLTDSIPTKIFESIGCGCPVLLAAMGDSVELIREFDLGYSAPPEDIEMLKSLLDQLLDSPFSEEQKTKAASYAIKNHSRQCAVEKLERILVQELSVQ